MTTLCMVYMESVAEGRIPGPDSEEAKEYRAWSWARKTLDGIRMEIGREVEIAEEEMGEVYR